MKKSVIRDFYDINVLVSIDNFVELLIASLANSSLIYHFQEKSKMKVAKLPLNYKEIIKRVMYDEKENILNYSKIIDIEQYYDNTDDWENEFDKALNNYFSKNNKSCVYNFEKNRLEIKYSIDELKEVFIKYDSDILNIASELADALIHEIYVDEDNNKKLYK